MPSLETATAAASPVGSLQPVNPAQKFHLRSAGHKRDIVAPVETGDRFVDRESGTPFVVVGEVLPTGETPSELPWATQNLRLCGCTREQLLQKDINDCPYCGRRNPAVASSSGSGSGASDAS